jgi:ppGpp synthetase/RelA/SpoT-type nucleotidyltranferase
MQRQAWACELIGEKFSMPVQCWVFRASARAFRPESSRLSGDPISIRVMPRPDNAARRGRKSRRDMSEDAEIEPVRRKYAEMHPKYERLAQEVRRVLETKLAEAGLAPVSVAHRAKDIDSLAAKITRKNYTDPFSETTDLAGVRAVCAYESELASVAKVIEANFKVKERIDKARDLGVDRMGYNGKAFVIVLGDRYAGGVYDAITDLGCEIQVRTILQDAWAIIDHQLVYKNEESTPERLRRDLNNVASLLEIAQGIFDSVKEKRATYITEIQQKKEDPPAFLAQPLDFDTVLAYTKWKFPNHKPSEKLTQILLRDIDLGKYPSLRQLDAVVDLAKPAVDAYQKENPDWFNDGTDFLTKSLGFVDLKFRKKHGFAPRTRAAFEKFQKLVPG